MHPAYLKARLFDARAREGSGGSPAAREERSAILGALVNLGLPENAYVRDPSRPRSALYLYRAEDGLHELGSVPWRLARHAPPGMALEDVRRVGRELTRGLLLSASGVVLAGLAAALAHILARAFVPAPPPESVTPAAYLHAAPAIFGCVAALCALAALWHLAAFLCPRGALADDAESRAAFGRAMRGSTDGASPVEERRGAAPKGRTAPRPGQDPSQTQER